MRVPSGDQENPLRLLKEVSIELSARLVSPVPSAFTASISVKVSNGKTGLVLAIAKANFVPLGAHLGKIPMEAPGNGTGGSLPSALVRKILPVLYALNLFVYLRIWVAVVVTLVIAELFVGTRSSHAAITDA